MMNKIELAKIINETTFHIDPYDYVDRFNSKEEGFKHICELLESIEQINAMILYFEKYLEELDDKEQEMYNEVYETLSILNLYKICCLN